MLARYILDAVITKFESDLLFKSVPGQFVSDHHAIICYVKCHEKPKESSKINKKMEEKIRPVIY